MLYFIYLILLECKIYLAAVVEKGSCIYYTLHRINYKNVFTLKITSKEGQ